MSAGSPRGGSVVSTGRSISGRMSHRSDVLVIASHLPGEGVLQFDRHRVDPVECAGDFDYWAGLARHWDGPLTLVNVEHDLEASDVHVDALLACPHPLCTWLYR